MLETVSLNCEEKGITEQHIKEGLSRAYIIAVSHATGLNIEESRYDYGIDGTISGVKILKNGRRVSNGVKLDFQLKSSVNIEVEDDVIKYALEAKNYNDLVDEEVATPRILILYKLPKEREQWINVTENNTILKHCAWWCHLRGKEPTNNCSSKTIEIPRNQILTVEALNELMRKVERGEII